LFTLDHSYNRAILKNVILLSLTKHYYSLALLAKREVGKLDFTLYWHYFLCTKIFIKYIEICIWYCNGFWSG